MLLLLKFVLVLRLVAILGLVVCFPVFVYVCCLIMNVFACVIFGVLFVVCV